MKLEDAIAGVLKSGEELRSSLKESMGDSGFLNLTMGNSLVKFSVNLGETAPIFEGNALKLSPEVISGLSPKVTSGSSDEAPEINYEEDEIPKKKKRTRRTKAQMEASRKSEEEAKSLPKPEIDEFSNSEEEPLGDLDLELDDPPTTSDENDVSELDDDFADPVATEKPSEETISDDLDDLLG